MSDWLDTAEVDDNYRYDEEYNYEEDYINDNQDSENESESEEKKNENEDEYGDDITEKNENKINSYESFIDNLNNADIQFERTGKKFKLINIKKTLPYMTTFEKARCISFRLKNFISGDNSIYDLEYCKQHGLDSNQKLAQYELESCIEKIQKVREKKGNNFTLDDIEKPYYPLIIGRKTPWGLERWKLHEFWYFPDY